MRTAAQLGADRRFPLDERQHDVALRISKGHGSKYSVTVTMDPMDPMDLESADSPSNPPSTLWNDEPEFSEGLMITTSQCASPRMSSNCSNVDPAEHSALQSSIDDG